MRVQMGTAPGIARAPKGIILRMDVRTEALRVLLIADPEAKCAATTALHQALQAGQATIDPSATLNNDQPLPGRPPLPRLVPVVQVPRRSPFTPTGRAALLHAVCHIEFNAINLGLDACWRFAGMPVDFYRDWLQVAAEEALHFRLLRDHLRTLDHDYGDFDAHDGLWTMCERTADDIVARMALVPRTLEARGLDATPPMQARLAKAGDHAAVAILDIILRDEVGHVAIGNHWYQWLCTRDGLDALALYPELARRHEAPRLRQPLNLDARRRAGFSEAELQRLAADAA